MKIYFQTKKNFSQSFHRIERELKKYIPIEVTWVNDWKDADFIIEQLCGYDESLIKKLKSGKPYAIIFNGGPRRKNGIEEVFENAEWVFSWVPLEEEGFKGNMVLSPLGVDPHTFKPLKDIKKDITIFTSGYVADPEGIDAMVEANKQFGGKLVHLGGDMINDFGCKVEEIKGVSRVNGISDKELVKIYNRSKYVSGLRRGEGFELPIIEGLLCGARPICFDNPFYRRWYDGLAIFVPELKDPQKLASKLKEIFESPYKPVTKEEINYVKDYFNWKRISKLFWSNLKQ